MFKCIHTNTNSLETLIKQEELGFHHSLRSIWLLHMPSSLKYLKPSVPSLWLLSRYDLKLWDCCWLSASASQQAPFPLSKLRCTFNGFNLHCWIPLHLWDMNIIIYSSGHIPSYSSSFLSNSISFSHSHIYHAFISALPSHHCYKHRSVGLSIGSPLNQLTIRISLLRNDLI